MGTSDGPVVAGIWRYPVKSLGGEQAGASWADERGLAGDRVWAVQDRDGKLGSGKSTRRFRRMAGLLEVSARYLNEPGADGTGPPAVTGPDGTQYPVATGAAEEFLRRSTGLADLRIRRDTGVMHFDEVPFTLIGTATIGWLADRLPGIAVDARRLRPNLVVATSEPFAEESWLGHPVRIGTGPEAACAVFDRVLERCVMVGMRQPGLGESGMVLKRITERGGHPLCLAIGGQITRGGMIRAGDPVHATAPTAQW